jgi:predicted RNase H-like HicB family nuclease
MSNPTIRFDPPRELDPILNVTLSVPLRLREERGFWVVEVPGLPGYVTSGTTKEEALAFAADPRWAADLAHEILRRATTL